MPIENSDSLSQTFKDVLKNSSSPKWKYIHEYFEIQNLEVTTRVLK